MPPCLSLISALPADLSKYNERLIDMDMTSKTDAEIEGIEVAHLGTILGREAIAERIRRVSNREAESNRLMESRHDEQIAAIAAVRELNREQRWILWGGIAINIGAFLVSILAFNNSQTSLDLQKSQLSTVTPVAKSSPQAAIFTLPRPATAEGSKTKPAAPLAKLSGSTASRSASSSSSGMQSSSTKTIIN